MVSERQGGDQATNAVILTAGLAVGVGLLLFIGEGINAPIGGPLFMLGLLPPIVAGVISARLRAPKGIVVACVVGPALGLFPIFFQFIRVFSPFISD